MNEGHSAFLGLPIPQPDEGQGAFLETAQEAPKLCWYLRPTLSTCRDDGTYWMIDKYFTQLESLNISRGLLELGT